MCYWGAHLHHVVFRLKDAHSYIFSRNCSRQNHFKPCTPIPHLPREINPRYNLYLCMLLHFHVKKLHLSNIWQSCFIFSLEATFWNFPKPLHRLKHLKCLALICNLHKLRKLSVIEILHVSVNN